MKKVTVRVILGKKVIQVKTAKGLLLSEALRENGLAIRLYCQGRGICGQCFVRVRKGRLSLESEAERKLRLQKKLPADYRLACQLKLLEPMTIEISPDLVIKEEIKPLSGLILEEKASASDFNPLVKKYPINLLDLRLKKKKEFSAKELENKISSLLGFKEINIEPSALFDLEKMREKKTRATAVVYDDQRVLDFEPGDTVSKTYALAVDLGTTTVSGQLLDLLTGKVLSAKNIVNLQTKYGSDLISRISFASERQENLRKLKQAALKSVEELISGLSRENGISPRRIYALTLAGNTVMNHLFLGMPIESLGRYPFQPLFISHAPVLASDLELNLNTRAVVYLCPNLASFVGGDIASGLLYAGLMDKPGNYLYVDLGTNGEIVLKKGETFLSTSTAAGPAFEGSGLSCGLQAVPGAIEKVKWQKRRFITETIGNIKPAGLCGSGLIGVLAEALKAGLLDPSGKILKRRSEIKIKGNIILTQEDIRKLQLAMAAIKSGLKLLLKAAGLKWQEMDGLYLAGAFGNSIDLRQCCSLGLLPPLPQKKIIFVGNASLAGARLVLLSQKARKEILKLPGRINFISLAGRQDFQSEFLKALALHHHYWRDSDE